MVWHGPCPEKVHCHVRGKLTDLRGSVGQGARVVPKRWRKGDGWWDENNAELTNLATRWQDISTTAKSAWRFQTGARGAVLEGTLRTFVTGSTRRSCCVSPRRHCWRSLTLPETYSLLKALLLCEPRATLLEEPSERLGNNAMRYIEKVCPYIAVSLPTCLTALAALTRHLAART